MDGHFQPELHGGLQRHDPLVSNALIAPPAITAPANVVEWIDYGPPATTSKPASVTNRFYRVYLNP